MPELKFDLNGPLLGPGVWEVGQVGTPDFGECVAYRWLLRAAPTSYVDLINPRNTWGERPGRSLPHKCLVPHGSSVLLTNAQPAAAHDLPVNPRDLQYGTMCRVVTGIYVGRVLMRCYDGLIDLAVGTLLPRYEPTGMAIIVYSASLPL